jgi:hypothetical protein
LSSLLSRPKKLLADRLSSLARVRCVSLRRVASSGDGHLDGEHVADGARALVLEE